MANPIFKVPTTFRYPRYIMVKSKTPTPFSKYQLHSDTQDISWSSPKSQPHFQSTSYIQIPKIYYGQVQKANPIFKVPSTFRYPRYIMVKSKRPTPFSKYQLHSDTQDISWSSPKRPTPFSKYQLHSDTQDISWSSPKSQPHFQSTSYIQIPKIYYGQVQKANPIFKVPATFRYPRYIIVKSNLIFKVPATFRYPRYFMVKSKMSHHFQTIESFSSMPPRSEVMEDCEGVPLRRDDLRCFLCFLRPSF